MNRDAILFTLGCRLNAADSALLISRLERANFRVVESAPPGSAALVVVNSCTVTAEAARKSRQAVRRFRAAHPDAFIVVTGCSAELDRELHLADGAADLVLSNPEKREIGPRILEALSGLPAHHRAALSLEEPVSAFAENAESRFPFRSRAFLKIQEGCDNYCTYCIVPYARGHERSRRFDEVIEDCRRAVGAGFPELVLTGVNTCAYRDAGRNLGALVREICAIEGDFRVRLSSTEPHPANRELIDVIASEPKVCRFLHLALQHGSDRILERMNRHYRRAEYADFVREARERIPDLHLGSDLIVGFPGEGEEEFADSCAFVESMRFANLHIFTYSPRRGTPAAEMPDRVPPEVARRRYRQLRELAERSRRAFAQSQCGRELPVIFETVDSAGFARGWSDNYLPIRLPASEAVFDRIVPILVTPERVAEDAGN